MDSAQKSYEPAAEETASLYVLELLAPEERRVFERQLDQDPSLRALVRDLQGNIDALVLDNPARPAPLQVWGRIATEVKAHRTTVIGFPARMPAWLPQLFAAAACLSLGALLHAWLTPSPDLSTAATPDQTASLPGHPTVMTLPPADSPPPIPSPQVTAVQSPPPVPTNSIAELEAVRLRRRINVLAAQVAALNQVLAQQVSIPNGTNGVIPEGDLDQDGIRERTEPAAMPMGVTRLQVFRLVNNNTADTPPTAAETASLPVALAALAARQHASPAAASDIKASDTKASEAATQTPGSSAGEVATQAPASNTGEVAIETPASSGGEVATETAASNPLPSAGTLLASTASLSLNDGQHIGFYDPETGHGAIALFNETPTLSLSYVVWAQTLGTDGSLRFQNIGVMDASSQTTVIPFNATASFSILPNISVTLEPADSATAFTILSAPTGPVVAALPMAPAPSATPPAPAP